MTRTRIAGGRPAKTAAPAAKAPAAARNGETFVKALLDAKKTVPKTLRSLAAPARRGTGGEFAEEVVNGERRLKILETGRARFVEITAKPASGPYAGMVTVTLKDQVGWTTAIRTYQVKDFPMPAIDLGSRIMDVKVSGEFATSVKLYGGKRPDTLWVDARGTKFAEANGGQSTYKMIMDFQGVSPPWWGGRSAGLQYLGSAESDYVTARSVGEVKIVGGAGDDVLDAQGGAGSVVEGGDGRDTIRAATGETTYSGGRDGDLFRITEPDALYSIDDIWFEDRVEMESES